MLVELLNLMNLSKFCNNLWIKKVGACRVKRSKNKLLKFLIRIEMEVFQGKSLSNWWLSLFLTEKKQKIDVIHIEFIHLKKIFFLNK